jgi:hypothetical protein
LQFPTTVTPAVDIPALPLVSMPVNPDVRVESILLRCRSIFLIRGWYRENIVAFITYQQVDEVGKQPFLVPILFNGTLARAIP